MGRNRRASRTRGCTITETQIAWGNNRQNGITMCEELKAALELQKELGNVDTTKGAIMLFKAAANSMAKMSAAMKEHIEEADKKWDKLAADIQDLKASFEEYKTDATKYRLIVEIFKALFGTTKRSIMTLIYFAFIMGAIHLKDILPILTSLAQ